MSDSIGAVSAWTEARIAAPEFARLVALARQLEAAAVAADADRMAARLLEGRFYVACVGQFKRGKSSLLNALVGQPVLPVGVPPVTAAITILRYGIEPHALVRFSETVDRLIRPDEVASYVSEARNSKNQMKVSAVEVWLPSPLLQGGLCLVDTPGVGSVLAANTDVTHAFLPHIDAAIVVLGGDPPISAEEIALVEAIAPTVDHLIFVQNKADRLSEADRAEAARFTRGVLGERLGRPVDRLIEVSATDRLSDRVTFDWVVLQQALVRLSSESASVLGMARRRERTRLVERLLAEIDARERALIEPFEDAEQRLADLRQGIDAADRAMRDFGQLLSVQQQELARTFEVERAAFVAAAMPRARGQLAAACRDLRGRAGHRRAQLMQRAGEIARDLVGDWIEQIEPEAGRLYTEAMARFVMLANDLLARLRRAGEPGAADPTETSFELEHGFRVRRKFFFTGLMHMTMPGPFGWLLDVLLPARWRQASVGRDAQRYLLRLIESNSWRVASDLEERVLESRRRLEADLRARLSERLEVAERALVTARARHADGEPAVRAELARLAQIRGEVEAIAALDLGRRTFDSEPRTLDITSGPRMSDLGPRT
jgi:predicted GTPase